MLFVAMEGNQYEHLNKIYLNGFREDNDGDAVSKGLKVGRERMVRLLPDRYRASEPFFINNETVEGSTLCQCTAGPFGWNPQIIQSPEGFRTLI